MVRSKLSNRFCRFAVGMMLGGSMFQLSGCDPNVRDALLAGLEGTTTSLTNTLISAFFISLEDDADGGSLTTT